MPSFWSLKKIKIGVGALLLVLGFFIYNITDDFIRAICYRLEVFGAGVYEYHALTGQWPDKAGDLAVTPMAARLRYWQDDLQSGRFVVVWPHDFKPNPKDNADRILVYHNAGLFLKFGIQWVCWGDLTSDYLTTAKLQAALKKEGRER